jgi:hypothetical protein
MKKAAGVLLLIAAAICFVGGVGGSFIAFWYCLVMAIVDIINIIKSDDPVTFWQVAGAILWYVLREIIAIVVFFGGLVLGIAAGAAGVACLSGEK